MEYVGHCWAINFRSRLKWNVFWVRAEDALPCFNRQPVDQQINIVKETAKADSPTDPPSTREQRL